VWDAADRAAALAVKRGKLDDIQAAMVQRLIQLGRVEPDFDPLTWSEGIRSFKGTQQQRKVHNLGKVVIGQGDYEDALRAQKLTPAYILHMTHKPARGKKAKESFHDKTVQLLVDHIKSTAYTSQATQKITTTAQADKAEGTRLLTYLYWQHGTRVSTSKRRQPKGKDAKASASSEMPENPTPQEE